MIATSSGLQQRTAFGRSLRRKLKRSNHAFWDGTKRKHDPVEIILSVNRERISELVPIKMARMAASPFGFFRGSVPVIAADLATLPSSGIAVQICGDAHVRNLGAYSGSDGRLVFDINDFDETICAPWEWDLKRLGASLVLAGRESHTADRACRNAVLACAETYRRKMTEFSTISSLEVEKYRIRRQFRGKPGSSVLQRAEKATPAHNLAKLTIARGKSRVFREIRPVLTHPAESRVRQVVQGLKDYRETLTASSQHALDFYRPGDVGFKVAGTGSVGTHDYVILHFAGDGVADPLFLQVKQALPSAYVRYGKASDRASHQGQRVVRGQRMLQAESDILLGWTSVAGEDYVVRQLGDHASSIQPDDLKGVGLIEYGTTCGEVLARGHARSGDPAVLAGYLGMSDRWDKALAKFSMSYADQTTKDYELFRQAIRSGKIKAGKTYS